MTIEFRRASKAPATGETPVYDKVVGSFETELQYGKGLVYGPVQKGDVFQSDEGLAHILDTRPRAKVTGVIYRPLLYPLKTS